MLGAGCCIDRILVMVNCLQVVICNINCNMMAVILREFGVAWFCIAAYIIRLRPLAVWALVPHCKH